MNDGLIDGFRHNAWATHQVLRACAGLSDAQLDTTVTGTCGSIIATLRHLVSSEAGYCRRLTDEEPDWYGVRDDAVGLNEHRTQVNTTLTSIGVQTPDLGPWDFAEATNRAPQRAIG